MPVKPLTNIGKIAVLLQFTVVTILLVFFVFMLIDMVDFDTGHWWDTVVGIVAPIEVIAFVLSVFASKKDKSVLVRVSLILGAAAIVFLLTHSLFISD